MKIAARLFQVPASTIRRHRRKPSLNNRVGHPNYLSVEEEEEAYFVSILQLLPEYGFSVTRDVALQLAAEYFQLLKLSHPTSEKWLRLFMKRHRDDIKSLQHQTMERERADRFTEEARVGWFSTLKEVMTKHDLFDKPQQLFNIDETGFNDKTKGKWFKRSDIIFFFTFQESWSS